ncbi:MAG: hypothetical protein ABJC13_04580 [Acidobacteriota bacterium]
MISPIATTYEHNIIVPIAVMPPLVPGKDPQLVCPAFIVPPGDWLIVWNLVTIRQPEIAKATFPAEKGIALMYGQGQNFDWSRRISETQWVASVGNGPKTAMAKVFPLSYVVSFYYPAPGSNKKVRYTTKDRGVISHDPTIVVSQDPIDG